MIRVRFAPSPTGYLHLGSARTALFNWLYARNQKGRFYLRIEDTDVERSTKENIAAIYRSLKWLGIDWDGDPVIQSEKINRHKEVVKLLLEKGCAYKCYCTKEKLEQMRQEASAKKEVFRYPGICRSNNVEKNTPYIVRFKTPQEGSTILEDGVQGKVTVSNVTIDDFVLMRQDGTPTYMLSVVVDDYDMEITHIIRGDDHLTNTFKQYHLYKALDWSFPKFFHIPLIHGEDGAKLSKRHGAVGVESYKEEGILPEALFNYLLRLGWSKGNEEIISVQQAIEWFDVHNLGKSPSRFNRDKLLFLNAHYLKEKANEPLFELLDFGRVLNQEEKNRILKGLDELKKRAKTILELQENAKFYVERPKVAHDSSVDMSILKDYLVKLEQLEHFEEECLLDFTKEFAKQHEIKLIKVAQPIRLALTGSTISPSIFEIMEILGKNETCERIRGCIH